MCRLPPAIRTIKLGASKTFRRSPKTEIAAIKLGRYDLSPATRFDANSRQQMEREMESRMPAIIDLNAELAKLTIFRRTPQSTREETKGSVARLASYRDGLLLAIKSSGTDHWERHLTGDELIHILDGTATLEIVCDDGPPKSFALRAGMIAVIPQGAWHRALSAEGKTEMTATPFPGDHIERDVDDPRSIDGKPAGAMAVTPSIIYLTAELAKLTTFVAGRQSRQWRIAREAPRDWPRTATVPSLPRSSRAKVIGNRISRATS
jgi:mannose-6-phosphate isomerase-like protein (cupin superfamily)